MAGAPRERRRRRKTRRGKRRGRQAGRADPTGPEPTLASGQAGRREGQAIVGLTAAGFVSPPNTPIRPRVRAECD